MNLYAVLPVYAPGNEVKLVLAETDAEAMQEGVYAAARDISDGNYFSPSAEVYLIASDVKHIGTAYATDAPRAWEWAYPDVLEAAAAQAAEDAERQSRKRR